MAKSKDTPKREAKKPRKEPIRKGQSHGGGRRMGHEHPDTAEVPAGVRSILGIPVLKTASGRCPGCGVAVTGIHLCGRPIITRRRPRGDH